MTTNQQDKMLDYIKQMSYFNAAEGGQWGTERAAREQLKAAAGIDMLSWLKDGLDLEVLKTFVDDNRHLSTFRDYLSDNMINAVLNDSLGVEL